MWAIGETRALDSEGKVLCEYRELTQRRVKIKISDFSGFERTTPFDYPQMGLFRPTAQKAGFYLGRLVTFKLKRLGG